VPGVVEAPADGIRHAVVDVYRDRLATRGAGDVPSRTLTFALPWRRGLEAGMQVTCTRLWIARRRDSVVPFVFPLLNRTILARP
jgi:hypothetical protein